MTLGDTHPQSSGAKADRKRASGRNDITVELAAQFGGRAHFYTGSLEVLQFRPGAITTTHGAPGEDKPTNDAVGGQNSHVEEAVVDAGTLEEVETAGQQTDVANHDTMSVAHHRCGAVDLNGDLVDRTGEVRYCGQRVGEPAEVVLQELWCAFDHGRVDAQPGHRHERLTVGVRHIYVQVQATKTSEQRAGQVGWHSEGPGEQVRGPARDDGQGDAATG